MGLQIYVKKGVGLKSANPLLYVTQLIDFDGAWEFSYCGLTRTHVRVSYIRRSDSNPTVAHETLTRSVLTHHLKTHAQERMQMGIKSVKLHCRLNN